MGGLSKKAHQLQELRSMLGETSLTLDAGGLLFEGATLSANRAAQEKITAEGIVAAYDMMGYEAVGIASNDLAAGLDYLAKLQQRSTFRWLSANIVRAGDDSALFTPYIIRKLPGITCAVIGITGNEAEAQLQGKKEVRLTSWQTILPQLTEKLAKQSDFIILLSSLSSQENNEVARSIPNIGLIIETNGAAGNKAPAVFANTLITHTFKQGKYLGNLLIDWQPSGVWRLADPRPELEEKRAALDRLNWQLRRMEEGGKPEQQFAKEPAKLANYRRLQEEKAKLESEVAALERQMQMKETDTVPSTFTASFIAMETTLPDQPEVLALVAGIKDKIAETGKQKRVTTAEKGLSIPGGDPREAGYIGWQRCAGCHAAITESWRRTPHADAFDTLVDKGQQFNQDCLVCHVTGIISGDEPYILTLPEELLQVGCEACHGPGKTHAEDSAAALTQKPEKSVCLRCHTPDQDDNFVFEVKSKLVHK